ncbi:MAG: AAA family ATPase [Elusimicrobia bacterium]|nr:AAA family ATPase [Elusimicrobiota bacterium]
MADIKSRKLRPKDLKNICDPAIFKFSTTDDIDTGEAVISQDRAFKAIDFGLNIKSSGFNMYISGVPGTGRNTTILREVKALAQKESVPEDICCIYNFDKDDEPRIVKLPAGKGLEFRDEMEELVKELEIEINKAFSGKDYEDKKREIVENAKGEKERLSLELEEYAQTKGFAIKQTLTGLVVVPLKDDGKPIKDRDYEKMSKEEKDRLENDQNEIYNKIQDFSRKLRGIQKRINREIEELDKKIVFFIMWVLIDDIKRKYGEYERITTHLDKIIEDILENLSFFKKEEEQAAVLARLHVDEKENKRNLLNKYKVNLLIDNSKTKGAPVIIEDNPTYNNLIGKLEHRSHFGLLYTDFTMIKPGAVLMANGGYLVIQALDLLKNYYAWEALKKIIEYRKVKIESLQDIYGIISTTTLKPEAVEVDIKVILIGSPYIYHLLQIYDEDFGKLFKIKADFDTTIKRNNQILQKFAQLIAQKTREEKLLPFGRSAVAKIIDFSSRLSDHKQKLTGIIMDIADIMRESNYWARKGKHKVVDGSHVDKALQEKVYRSNMIEEKIKEMIRENTIFLDIKGKDTGQINGLAVIDLGDYMFGKPSKITAKTYMGKGEVINIERETHMSGKIHSKGVMILTSYLGEKFGQDKPLSFAASICFEQLYEGVEGDSASSTELYCLLSSLADIPLRQDIAVTGSVNQKGQVQPVGGINEKIEGFYDVCKVKGFTGKQGVMIPASNVKNLMLKDEVIKAVAKNRFHIYSVETIEQGIEVLSGMKAGKRQKNGKFPEDTFYHSVDKKLKYYADLSYKYGKDEKEPPKKKKKNNNGNSSNGKTGKKKKSDRKS